MDIHPGIEECDICNGDLDPDAPRAVGDLLTSLVVGDIFHASSTGGASLICIVAEVSPNKISARRFTTGDDLEFDRSTGALLNGMDQTRTWIDTIEPLPSDVHNTFLEMDRRYRLGGTFHRVKLTPAEIDAMMRMSEHVRANAFRQVANDSGVSP